MKIPHAAFVCFAAVGSFFSVCYATEDMMPPENAIPLYTHNFTRINDYCTGNFTLAEHINGSLLHNNDFPICPNSSQPLNNAWLTHGGYRVQNLNISNSGISAIFGAVNNAEIDLIFEKPRSEGNQAAIVAHTVQSNSRVKATFYKGGDVIGLSAAGMLVFHITGDNNHIIQVGGDNEIQTVMAAFEAGGTVAQILGCNNQIEQQGGSLSVATNQGGANIFAAGVAAFMQNCADNSLTQRRCRIKVSGIAAAGAVQSLICPNTTINQIQCQIEITGGRQATGGINMLSNNNTLTQTDNRINVTCPSGVATAGLAITGSVSNTILIQTNNQMSITGTTATSAFLTTVTGSQDLQLLLYSGNLMDNQATTVCPDSTDISVTGLIDIAGYTIDAESCSSQVARLNSTEPDDWHRLQQSFCEYAACAEDTSCHYPNEQLQALVPAGNGTLWLVTRQGYPSNPDSDSISPVRISRFLVNGTATGNGISPDNSFGTEGVRVLTPSPLNTEPLPHTPPVARTADQNGLSLLYATPENNGVLLANFPLSEEIGNDYDTHAIPELSGQPVLLSQGVEENSHYLWTREQDSAGDTLRRYTLSFTNFIHEPDIEYNLAISDYPGAPVIGLGIDSQWLYIARHQGSNVIIERLDLITAQLDSWSAILEDILVAINSTGLSYRLESAGNQLYLVPVVEGVLQPEYSATPKAFRVAWPQYGGCAQWISYSLQPVLLNELTTSSSPVPSNPAPNQDNPDHTGAIIGSVLGGSVLVAGAAAAGIIALIKYKKLKDAQCVLPPH